MNFDNPQNTVYCSRTTLIGTLVVRIAYCSIRVGTTGKCFRELYTNNLPSNYRLSDPIQCSGVASRTINMALPKYFHAGTYCN